MARSQISDFLHTGYFHVLDVSLSIPPVFLPVFGFARCVLPSMNMEISAIKEGNYEFPRKVVRGASVTPVVLEQGVQIFNSDFWDWTRKSIQGKTPAKNLLIVQFHRSNLGSSGAASFGGSGPVPFEFITRLPGRAWYLTGCRPLSYRPGTDLDGMNFEVSIATLEIDFEQFTQIDFGI